MRRVRKGRTSRGWVKQFGDDHEWIARDHQLNRASLAERRLQCLLELGRAADDRVGLKRGIPEQPAAHLFDKRRTRSVADDLLDDWDETLAPAEELRGE